MAKKFAEIKGLHSIYEFQVGQTTYDVTRILESAQDLVNKNTICFIIADHVDEGRFVEKTEIKAKDKFIVVQGNLFALYRNPEDEEETYTRWRPIYVGAVEATDTGAVEFTAGSYMGVTGSVDDATGKLTIQYGFDGDTLITEIQEYVNNYYTTVIQPDITELQSGVSGLQAGVSGLQEDVEGLKTGVSGLQEDVEGLKTGVSGLQNDITELQSGVSGLQNEIEYLQTGVSGLQEDVEGLKTGVSGLQEDVEGLRGAVEELQTGVSGLYEIVEGHSGTLEEHQQKLDDLQNQINNIEVPEIPTPGDGKLIFEKGSTSSELADNSIEIEVKPVNEPESNPEENEENSEEEQKVFSANTDDDFVAKIKYTGRADRLDWYIDQDTRLIRDGNDAKAKKFVYVEPLHEYFQQNGFPNISSVQPDKKDLISQDSIVFITCGETEDPTTHTIMTDEQFFNNPEFVKGARFIWTQNRLFSCNSWMPLYTKATSDPTTPEFKVSPVIGDVSGGHGQFAKLVIEGKGGIVIDNTTDGNTKYITIDGSRISGGGGGGTANVVEGPGIALSDTTEGTKISVFSPEGNPTVESQYGSTGKNFIHFQRVNPESQTDLRQKIVVNGVDASNIYIDREIDISGTALAEIAIANHDFDDWGNKIPVGKSLQEVIEKLLHKDIPETYPELELVAKIYNLVSSVGLTAKYKSPGDSDFSRDMSLTGTRLLPGTQILLTVSKTGTGAQKITGLIGATFGYKIGSTQPTGRVIDGSENGGVISDFSQFLQPGAVSPVVISQDLFEGNSNSGFTGITGGGLDNQIILEVPATKGTKSYSVGNIIKSAKPNQDMSNIRIYPLSNKGIASCGATYVEITKAESDWTKDPVIPASKTVSIEVPEESYGSPTKYANLSLVNDTPVIGVSGPNGNVVSGSTLPVGTVLTATIGKTGSATQSISVHSFKTDTIGGVDVGGYIIGSTTGQIHRGATYTKNDFIPNFYNDQNRTGYKSLTGFTYIGITGSTNQIRLIVNGGGENSITIENKCGATSANFNDIELYKVSNWNNTNASEKVTVSKNDFTPVVGNKTVEFKINPLYPYFIGSVGSYNDVHDFSGSGNHAAFILNHIGSGATSTIKFEEYDANVPNTLSNVGPNSILGSESLQLIIAVPANQVAQSDWITVVDLGGYPWTDIDDDSFKAEKNTITIYGSQYKVYTISAKSQYDVFGDYTKFNVTFNK